MSLAPLQFKLSKTQFSHVCERTLWKEHQWFDNIVRHIDTKAFKPKPTTIAVADEGRRFGKAHNLLSYSDDFIRAWCPSTLQVTDADRRQFPLFGNVMLVYSDKAYAKAGYGNPHVTEGLEHVRFY